MSREKLSKTGFTKDGYINPVMVKNIRIREKYIALDLQYVYDNSELFKVDCCEENGMPKALIITNDVLLKIFNHVETLRGEAEDGK